MNGLRWSLPGCRLMTATGNSAAIAGSAFAAMSRASRPPWRGRSDAPDRQINVGKTETRPALSVVRPAENVVPFRAAADAKPTILSPVERTAFRELATTLTARLKGADELARGQIANDLDETPAAGFPVSDRVAKAAANAGDSRLLAEQRAPLPEPSLKEERPILDRLPVGLLIHRHDSLIYANRAFLEWTGCETLADFSQAGGLDSLFIEPEQQSAEPIRVAGSGSADRRA